MAHTATLVYGTSIGQQGATAPSQRARPEDRVLCPKCKKDHVVSGYSVEGHPFAAPDCECDFKDRAVALLGLAAPEEPAEAPKPPRLKALDGDPMNEPLRSVAPLKLVKSDDPR